MLMILKFLKWGVVSLILSIYYCFGQALPPVAHFQTEDYGADNQNWAITQTQDQTLFFANGKGLLTYDGEHWELLGSPNNTILRSAHAVGDVVYTGAYMEFGVWQKNLMGDYEYSSLSTDVGLIEDEQFWTISTLNNDVYFQSLDAIYRYDTLKKDVSSIKVDGDITKMVIIDDELYFHIKNAGLYKLVNGQQLLVNDSQLIKESILINLYKINNQLYAQTQFNGILNLETSQPYIPINSTSIWPEIAVYSSIQKSNGDLYLGTISNGLLKVSKNKVVYNLNQNNTLSNNTVLSIYEGMSNNIWLGLDNGINSIDDDSHVSIYNDTNGQIGTIYTTLKHNGLLYVGSNQGLFYFNTAINQFSLVEGTNGQVWSLFAYENTLFCAHHNGTFIIDNDQSKFIANTKGTWAFRVKDKNTVLSGNYDGLYLYKFDKEWNLEKKIKGFDISSQYFEFIDSATILVNHEYKGLIKLNLDNTLTNVIDYNVIKSVDKGLLSSIVKYKDRIFYTYKEGVFKFDHKNLLDRFTINLSRSSNCRS